MYNLIHKYIYINEFLSICLSVLYTFLSDWTDWDEIFVIITPFLYSYCITKRDRSVVLRLKHERKWQYELQKQSGKDMQD